MASYVDELDCGKLTILFAPRLAPVQAIPEIDELGSLCERRGFAAGMRRSVLWGVTRVDRLLSLLAESANKVRIGPLRTGSTEFGLSSANAAHLHAVGYSSPAPGASAGVVPSRSRRGSHRFRSAAIAAALFFVLCVSSAIAAVHSCLQIQDDYRLLCFSHDGTEIAGLGSSGSIDVWRVAANQKIRHFEAPRGEIASIAFTPDDSRLSLLTKDGPAFMLSTEDGAVLRRVAFPSGQVDGSRRALASDGLHFACQWLDEEGRAHLLTGRLDSAATFVDETPPTYVCESCLPPLTDALPVAKDWQRMPLVADQLALSPDGSRLVGLGDEAAYVVDARTRSKQIVAKIPENLRYLANTHVVIAGRETVAWVAADEQLFGIDLIRGSVLSATKMPMGCVSIVAAASTGRIAGAWGSEFDPTEPAKFVTRVGAAGLRASRLETTPRAMALSDDGRLLCWQGTQLAIGSVDNPGESRVLGIAAERPSSVLFDSTGCLYVGLQGGGEYGTLAIDWRQLQRPRWLPFWIPRELSADGTCLLGESNEHADSLVLKRPAPSINASALSVYSPRVGEVRSIRVPVLNFGGGAAAVRNGLVWALFGADENGISPFTAAYGPLVVGRGATRVSMDSACSCADLAPDGQRVVACIKRRPIGEYALQVQDAVSGVVRWESRSVAPWTSARFSRAGRWVAACHIDSMPCSTCSFKIEVRDANTGQLAYGVSGVNANEYALAPDEHYLATAAGDTITVRSIPDGAAVWRGSASIAHGGVSSFAFAPNGRVLAYVAPGGTIAVRDVEADSLRVEIAVIPNATHAEGDFGCPDYVAFADGYYALSSHTALRTVAYDGGDASEEALACFFNRPEEVCARLTPMPDSIRAVVQALRSKRLAALGVSDNDIFGGDSLASPHSTVDVVSGEIPLFTAADHVSATLAANGHTLWDLRVNGTPINVRAVSPGAYRSTVSFTAPLLSGVNVIEARCGRSARRRWNTTMTRKVEDGRLYFVGIGVSRCGRADCQLPFASKDVRDVCRTLVAWGRGDALPGAWGWPVSAPHSRSYSGVDTLLLIDSTATEANLAQVGTFLRRARPQDLVVVYLAGHGDLVDSTFVFGTYGFDRNRPRETGTPLDSIEKVFQGVQAYRKLLCIDACHAGDPIQALPGETRGIRERAVLPELFALSTSHTGAVVLAASGSEELAFEVKSLENGAFTRAFVEALGGDRNHDGVVSLYELCDYVVQAVAKYSHDTQIPMIRENIPGLDYPVW